MKKNIISLLLAILMLCSMIPTAFATTNKSIDAANVLHDLGLFNGVGTNPDGTPNFDLDRTPTRHEAVTMLVTLLGKSDEAQNGNWSTPFVDVVDWAKPYVGYAYANGLTSGTRSTTFGGNSTITASQYLTFVLCALGYSNGADFKWDAAWELSDKIGLTSGEYDEKTEMFLRGDVAQISSNALSILQKNSAETLAEKLINDGVFTKALYDSTVKNEGMGIDAENEYKIVSSRYSFVRIDGQLYEIVYSYELKNSRSNEIYYADSDPSIVYLDSQATNDMWNNSITLSLLTGTYKTTTSDNPYVHKAIDMFSTYYESKTINVEKQKQYLSATESYYTTHHSYRGKTINIPYEIMSNMDNTVTTIDGIRYCGRYINLEDYCKFFSLHVSVKVEFDEKLNQNILVVNYS